MKYTQGVKNRLEEDETGVKEISRNAKLGKSELNVQISLLDAQIVKADQKKELKEEAYEASKYEMPFNLSNVDSAEYEFEGAKAELKKLKGNLANRKALLKELF